MAFRYASVAMELSRRSLIDCRECGSDSSGRLGVACSDDSSICAEDMGNIKIGAFWATEAGAFSVDFSTLCGL